MNRNNTLIFLKYISIIIYFTKIINIFRVIKNTVENNQLSKNSQTGPTSHVSSESRHQWQLHTPVSDILDCENSKMNYFKKMKKKAKGKRQKL